MLAWLLLGVLLALLLFWLLGWWSRTDVKSAKSALFWIIIIVCFAIGVLLMATGRGLFAVAPIGYAAWRFFGHAMSAKNIYDRVSGGNKGQERSPHSKVEAMSRSEAFDVLGLEEGASEADINIAYKKMMARVHPDKGGNDWMAAKINEAKRVLLGDHP